MFGVERWMFDVEWAKKKKLGLDIGIFFFLPRTTDISQFFHLCRLYFVDFRQRYQYFVVSIVASLVDVYHGVKEVR